MLVVPGVLVNQVEHHQPQRHVLAQLGWWPVTSSDPASSSIRRERRTSVCHASITGVLIRSVVAAYPFDGPWCPSRNAAGELNVRLP